MTSHKWGRMLLILWHKLIRHEVLGAWQKRKDWVKKPEFVWRHLWIIHFTPFLKFEYNSCFFAIYIFYNIKCEGLRFAKFFIVSFFPCLGFPRLWTSNARPTRKAWLLLTCAEFNSHIVDGYCCKQGELVNKVKLQ